MSMPDAYAGDLPVAYVVLRGGETVEEDALIDFARTHISQRSAVPKKIYIIDALPLTAVGKVFKPTLKYDAIRREIERVLPRDGIVNIGVDGHAIHGTPATIDMNAKY